MGIGERLRIRVRKARSEKLEMIIPRSWVRMNEIYLERTDIVDIPSPSVSTKVLIRGKSMFVREQLNQYPETGNFFLNLERMARKYLNYAAFSEVF